MTETPTKGRAPLDLQGWREHWERAGPRLGSSHGIREHRRGSGVAKSCPPKDLIKHNGFLLPVTIATLATPFLLPSPPKRSTMGGSRKPGQSP